jgi:hypothetical protein
MTQSLINFFVDDASVVALEARVPNAVFNSGMFAGASNAPGIGISSTNPGLDESLPSWTLLDQGEASNDYVPRVRINQRSQCIGGPGITLTSDWPGSGGQEGSLPAAVATFIDPADLPTYADKLANGEVDGQIPELAPTPGCALNTLAAGWEAGV